MNTAPRGYILYEGPSILDGQPIVVIATLKTNNRKTGDMVQTWIIRSDINPVEAAAQNADISICGNCPHKGTSCYVNIGQAPNAVYKAYKRGAYPYYDNVDALAMLEGRAIRFGAYGDPAAAPTAIWAHLADIADKHTGYTHQLNHKHFDPRILRLVMASADSPKQADRFNQVNKARTFRVMNAGDMLRPNEIECLADSKGLSCADCTLCDGNRSNQPNIAITVHGGSASKFNTANVIARG